MDFLWVQIQSQGEYMALGAPLFQDIFSLKVKINGGALLFLIYQLFKPFTFEGRAFFKPLGFLIGI